MIPCTCNPPGPDNSHAHTCFHFHTKTVTALIEDKASVDDTAESREKDIRGRIKGEMGSFPHQKPATDVNTVNVTGGAYVMNPCNVQIAMQPSSWSRRQIRRSCRAECARIE
ncbi:basic leucine zipper 23-like [Hibiscus syriacus]|uniref:basic leucine zipper 23-like n=1 Tax=Hibiscus syriacus TaxID=106335 RepID=UPI0019233099|nr:basic leucine zipper 23-like [Hibiscus syriacus]